MDGDRCRDAARPAPLPFVARSGSRGLVLAVPGHQKAEALARERLDGLGPGEPAPGDHRDAVGEREELVEVLRDQDHRRRRARAPREGAGAPRRPRRRRARGSAGSPGPRAGCDRAPAPGSPSGCCRRKGGGSARRGRGSGCRKPRWPPWPAPASRSKRRKPARWTSGEPRVSSARFSAIDSEPTMPSRWRSSGMRAMPASIMARGDGLVSGSPASVRAPAPAAVGSGDDAGERRLPVARNAGDADDLAGAHLERRLLQPGAALLGSRRSRDQAPAAASPGVARLAAALRDLAPDHQGGEGRAGQLPRSAGLRPCARRAAPRRGRRSPAPRPACAR